MPVRRSPVPAGGLFGIVLSCVLLESSWIVTVAKPSLMPNGANGWARRESPPEVESPGSAKVPAGLRVAGLGLRALFMACLLVLTLRVSMPQNETIWTIYDTPGDVVRLALGLAVCIGILVQLFRVPADAQSYRTWIYLGAAAVPFTLICIFAVW
jgi:hypothetical protein